jgi:hypothetical protein
VALTVVQGKDRQAGLTGGMVQVQVELTEAIDIQNQTIGWTVTGGGGSVPGKDALGSHVTSSRRQFMSRFPSSFFTMLVGGLLLPACGGGGDGGNGPGAAAQPTQAERNTMATALNAAAVNAEAAGDGLGTLILKGAAGMIGGGLTVTEVSGVNFIRGESAVVRMRGANMVGNGWAFGAEIGMVQGQEVGAYEGAVVISGSDIAFGFGLAFATPGFVGSSIGQIWSGPNAGWGATTMTGIGQADSIIGGNCLNSLPAGTGVTECTPASLHGPGFNITASAPLPFPGNTAAGSNTMAFGPPRLRGAVVTVDCQQTSVC